MLREKSSKETIMDLQKEHQVTQSDLNNLKQWFSGYVHSFYCTDPIIQEALLLKEEHSLSVCEEILNIGRGLNMTPDNLRLAEVMALFHDIGRFEQVTRYKTFVDGKSENHAQLGVKILKQENTLKALDTDTRDLILQAIFYHNRLSIPEDEGYTCLCYSRLLRDADKLDIFNIVSAYYVNDSEKSAAVELDLPDTPTVSDKVIKSINEGKMISMQQLQSLNDFKLLQMSWVHDINYQPTFQLIFERDYLQKIRNTLPATEEIDRIYSKLITYLKENI
jgi:putative nucleotidyltransferase with HDIG domain